MSTLLSLALSVPAAAGALGPGVPVKQVVPPPVVLDGVTRLELATSGPRATEIAAEIREALASQDRAANVSGAELGSTLVSTAANIGGAYVGGLVGGGLGGKAVSGLTKGVGAMVAEELENEPLVLDDGLRIDVFTVVPAGGDALLSSRLETADSARDYTKKEPRLYEDGTFVKDEHGNIVYDEIACRAVSVTVSFVWGVTKGGASLHDQTWSRTASDDRCGEDLANLASAGALAEPLLYGWGGEVAATIAPSWRFDRLPMDREPHLAEELKLVRAGAWDRSLCGLVNASAYDPHDGTALLDQGVLHEAMGRFDEAGTLYQQALSSGQKGAAKALARVDQRRTEVATLQRAYGLRFRPAAFDAALCPPMPEGRRVAVSKDTPLLAANGTLLTELERGTRLFVTEEGGDPLQVALTDGTAGFVDPKRVK